MDKKNFISVSEWPVRDLEMEVLEALERDNPEMVRALYSRTRPFPDPKIITITTRGKHNG